MKKVISGSWSLEVKGDTLDSYLPYFGRAFEPVFGETKVLNFDAPPILVRYLLAIYSVLVRYNTEHIPDKYRTSTEHE
jgi:hypothetical protein